MTVDARDRDDYDQNMPSTTISHDTVTLGRVTPEELAEARRRGRAEVEALLEAAPQHPLLRIAWAQGASERALLEDAVAEARALGVLWGHIAEAAELGDAKAAETRFGRGAARAKAYRQRQRLKRQLRGDDADG